MQEEVRTTTPYTWRGKPRERVFQREDFLLKIAKGKGGILVWGATARIISAQSARRLIMGKGGGQRKKKGD